MTVGRGFRRLTRVLRRIERADWVVEAVAPATGSDFCTPGNMHLNVVCSASDVSEGEPDRCPMALTEHLADLDSCDVTLRRFDDERSSTMAELTISIALSGAGNGTDTASDATADRPLHRDPDRLVELYDRYESFAAMAEAIEERVSAETIRRYAIEHGIHTPGSESGERPEEATTEASPAIDVDEVISVVETAHTLYDVQRELGLDRKGAVAVLREHDLLDLVVGRLGREEHGTHRGDVVRERVRAAAGGDGLVPPGRNR